MSIDHYTYWEHPPPGPSARLLLWVSRIKAGWRPNRRIRQMGRDACKEFYDVYQWEWSHVIDPLLDPIGGRTAYRWNGRSWEIVHDEDGPATEVVVDVEEEKSRWDARR